MARPENNNNKDAKSGGEKRKGLGRLIGRTRVLAQSGWCSGRVLGTLYVYDHEVRFDPKFILRTTVVATHLPWSAVSSVRRRGSGPFGAVEVVHHGGVEIYRCLGAGRLAGVLTSAHSGFKRPARQTA